MNGYPTDRRALLRNALVLAGAGAALGACDFIGEAEPDSPFRYSAADMALLTAIADVMIPQTETAGAVAAKVPATFEGLMANWAASRTRSEMGKVLGSIGALADGGRKFAELDRAKQGKLLAAHDAAALTPSGGPQLNPFGPPPVKDPAYQRFKELVVTLYYLSEPALTQELSYVHIPGEWKPSIPVTSDTRPQGGPGMF